MSMPEDYMAEIPMHRPAFDPACQVRVDGLDREHVTALGEALDELPPPTVVRRDKSFVPLDGHHTEAAYQNAGREKIPVHVVPPPPNGDLYAAAFERNRLHGRALTLKDRTAFAEHLLQRDPQISNMEVSRQAGLAPTTVQAVRARLEDRKAIAPTDRVVTRGGTTYSFPAPSRKPGELPPERIAEHVGRLFSSAERKGQRQVTSFLRRIGEAMEDGIDLLAEPEEAARAVVLVLGHDKAEQLGRRLVGAGSPIVAVGRVLSRTSVR